MRKNEAGFTPVEGLLILIIIGVVGFVGWYVWQAKQKNNKTLDSSATSQVTPLKTASPAASATSQPGVKYLEIPEYGVKFALSPDISDAYYEKNTEPTAGVALRVHSLDPESDCKTGKNSVAAISKVGKDEVNPLADNKKYSDVMKGAIIGDYFYYISNAQYSCVQDSKNQPQLEKVRAAFTTASSTIEKL